MTGAAGRKLARPPGCSSQWPKGSALGFLATPGTREFGLFRADVVGTERDGLNFTEGETEAQKG